LEEVKSRTDKDVPAWVKARRQGRPAAIQSWPACWQHWFWTMVPAGDPVSLADLRDALRQWDDEMRPRGGGVAWRETREEAPLTLQWCDADPAHRDERRPVASRGMRLWSNIWPLAVTPVAALDEVFAEMVGRVGVAPLQKLCPNCRPQISYTWDRALDIDFGQRPATRKVTVVWVEQLRPPGARLVKDGGVYSRAKPRPLAIPHRGGVKDALRKLVATPGARDDTAL
jgi:hypothetical protein